ncbi:hypothetical protein FNJ84_17775 [Paracoccus sp. M683]|uniref:hypothetical protein n=1 Tax=Paracoccus sp. M683 TaxID=2594268 RepID=UPI00117EE0B3|nr:hypothetical protein [Paracoccus sp. M683]TRW94942.1 hypothetical protein FNJ84_17775 [Paracoccus sp. M683]
MFLYIRMVLYFVFAWLAGMGYGEMSADGAFYRVPLDLLTQIIAGAVGFVGTFIVGRIAEGRGGKT